MNITPPRTISPKCQLSVTAHGLLVYTRTSSFYCFQRPAIFSDGVCSAADVPDAVRLSAGVRPGDRCVEDRGGATTSRQTFPARGQHPSDRTLGRRDSGRHEAASLRHGGPSHGRPLGGTVGPARPQTSSSTRARSATGVCVWTVQVAQEDSHVQVSDKLSCNMIQLCSDLIILSAKEKVVFYPALVASRNSHSWLVRCVCLCKRCAGMTFLFSFPPIPLPSNHSHSHSHPFPFPFPAATIYRLP